MPNDNMDDFTTKTRVCPSCRETINVLAVKCRFCGEDVGRPKDAARELTIHDLGGETIRHAAPSGSVMDALKTYRAEEGPPEEEEAAGSDDLPELDSRNQDLASITFDRPGSTAYQHPKSTAADKMKMTIKVVAVLAIVILVAVKGVPWLVEYMEERGKPPEIVHVNRALQILQTGTHEEALDAAIVAVETIDNVANRQILGEVIGAIKTRTNELLNAAPWDEANLNEAKELMAMATIKWPTDDALMTLKIEVDREVQAYCMYVTSMGVFIDEPKKNTAQLESCDRSKNPQTVRVGNFFGKNGRFEVVIVYAGHVVLEDTRRNNRKITLKGKI